MKKIRIWLAGLIVALGSLAVFTPIAGAVSITCHHGAQAIHEIYAPASWPGTRAAHVVSVYSGLVIQTVYTKSGWWDPTWDYYYTNTRVACVG